ncbi:MAG: DUF4910 domain-containing protein [Bacteroidales bacterium]|jgi:aminopeptidase-like protein
MQKIYKQLFDLNRSLVGKDNDKALEIINSNISLKLYKFKSGTKCFDWTIPKEWKLNRAVLKNLKGNIIINSNDNILHVLNYSTSFKGIVKKEDLLKHLHTNPKLPDSIPYRTSYYDKSWGFCLSHNQYLKLKDKEYFVDIDSEFMNSHLSIGEATINEGCKKTIILSSYICHPQQANDGLSGVILLLYLYKLLLKEKKLKFTYKFYFLPETIGTIVLLSKKIINPKNIEYAIVSTCVGHGKKITYKKTFIGNHSIDNISKFVLKKYDNRIADYTPVGSDERQYSSPNIEIPCASIMRTPYYEFDEYHTSFDNLNFVSLDLIKKTADIYKKIILLYEKNKKIVSKIQGCEPFLSKCNLYRKISVPGHNDESILRNWILHLSNGNNNAIDICEKSGYSLDKVGKNIKILIGKKLIKYLF